MNPRLRLHASRWLRAVMPACLLLAGCATPSGGAAPAGMDGLGARVLQQYIRPQAAVLVRSTRDLDASLRAYCADPASAPLRDSVDTRLREVASAWAGMEFLRFGPLVEQNRLEQFFFWPDPRGVMQRQMRALFNAGDAALFEAQQLRAQSVAVQGLPALEYALHADDARALIAGGSDAGRYRCAYSSAIAANLARLAGEIDAGWSPRSAVATELAHPAADNDLYRSSGEVATEVLKALSTALHVARDQKLQPALAEDAASARGTLLPLYRSGLTAAFLAAHAEALQRFVAAAAFEASLPEDSKWIDSNLRDELQRVRQDFAELTMPADRAVGDADERELLVHAALLLSNARAIVDEYLAPALDVNLGFNSLDGD